MSRAAVEQVIDKLVTDANFRASMSNDMSGTLAGFDLTDEERQLFGKLDLTEVHGATEELDRRISKAKLGEMFGNSFN